MKTGLIRVISQRQERVWELGYVNSMKSNGDDSVLVSGRNLAPAHTKYI